MNNTNDNINAVLAKFCLDGQVSSVRPYGEGVINKTYIVETESGSRYILQKLNENAFKNIPAIMENIEGIARFLKEKKGEEMPVLEPVYTKDGSSYYKDEDGYFRVTPFAEGTICLQAPESLEDFYQCAVGFGRFISDLADYPAESLNETIPNFHNTKDRYRIFKETLAKNPAGRAASVEKEISFLLDREEEMSRLSMYMESGVLPVRVTHNDTKLNNLLLDAKTRTPKYVIDLDTVMPGLSLYDYGDCIRFGANTAAEDEPDTDKISLDLERFRVFTEGFAKACPNLTDKEYELLPLGAKTITCELACRFLTDYLDGDNYFATRYDGHNLVRARAQMKLVASMEEKWEEMNRIVSGVRGKE